MIFAAKFWGKWPGEFLNRKSKSAGLTRSGETLFFLDDLNRLAAKKNRDIPDASDQLTSSLLCKLGGEFLLFVFEIVEFDLDELLMLKSVINGRQELRGQTFFADPEGGFHALCPGFEIAYLCVAKRTHRSNLHGEGTVAEEFFKPNALPISLA
jgi:hypothetical protein